MKMFNGYRTFIICLVSAVFLAAPPLVFAGDQKPSICISDVLLQAYNNSPVLKSALARLDETQEVYSQARAGWLPTVEAETSVYSTDIESSNFGSADGATTKDMTLSLNQPVFRGGRTVAEVARARNIILSERFTLANAEQNLFLKTVTVYMNLLSDREILELRMNNESILQSEMTAVQQRQAIGERTITDVQQTAARYNRARAETTVAFGNLRSSEAEFIQVTGMDPPDGLVTPSLDLSFPDHLEEMILLAKSNNPEIQAARYQQRAAEFAADSAFGKLLPQISAYASYNRQYDPQPGIVNDSETKTVGLKAMISFYDGGSSWSRMREARKAAKRLTYDISEVEDRIKQEVTKNWQMYQAFTAEAESRVAEIESAELALNGVREESRLGQRTMMDVLDADKDVIEAKIASIRVHRDMIVSCYSLAASLGRLSFDDVNVVEDGSDNQN